MLTNTIKTYLSVRRALGFKLQSVEKYLWNYANFATARGDIRVLSKTAVEWAELASSENQRSNRLKILIRFARFAQAEDSGHQIPPDNIFYGRLNRRTPYIFTDEEIKQLILHATRLVPLDSLRPHTYSTLFGLLASTGMRISEALSLRSRILPRKDWSFVKLNFARVASYGSMRPLPRCSNSIFSADANVPLATIISLSRAEVVSSATPLLPKPFERFSKPLAFKLDRVVQSLDYTI